MAFALIGAIALWLGVSAVVRSRRRGTGRPRGSVLAIILGSIGVLFSGLLLITFAVLWKPFSAYSQCMRGANTLAAQHTCQDQLRHGIGRTRDPPHPSSRPVAQSTSRYGSADGP